MVPSEQQEQEAIFAWRDMAVRGNPDLAMLISTQPGARVSMGTAMKLKRAGMPKGFPDLALLLARNTNAPLSVGDVIWANYYHGLFIELKRKDAPPSAVKAEQREWAVKLEQQGYKCVVCRGASMAIKTIERYLDGEL